MSQGHEEPGLESKVLLFLPTAQAVLTPSVSLALAS